MSKRKKIPKKQKGVRYIAKKLQKYGGKKYKNYRDALAKSREVFSKLKESDQKVTVKNVLDLTRTHREPKEKPRLFYKLTAPEPYFSLVDYSTYIHDTTPEVTFVSTLFNEGLKEIQGGQRPSYRKTFSGFVDYLNKKIPPSSRDQAYDYRVMALPPEYDRVNKRWVSQIVGLDPDGEPTDFDYIPTIEPEGKAKKEAKEKKPLEPRPKKSEKTDTELAQELELKITKEKSIQQVRELFLKGLINKKEYKDEIDRISKL